MAVRRIRSEESGAALKRGSMVAQPCRVGKYSILAIGGYFDASFYRCVVSVAHVYRPCSNSVGVVTIHVLYGLQFVAGAKVQPRSTAGSWAYRLWHRTGIHNLIALHLNQIPHAVFYVQESPVRADQSNTICSHTHDPVRRARRVLLNDPRDRTPST